MSEITLLQCQRFLAKSFPETKAQQWKKLHKEENSNGPIYRKFNHELLGEKTLLEKNNTLILDNSVTVEYYTWKENLEEHFSDQCYEGETYTLQQMIYEYLIIVQNGVQNGDCTVSFEFIDGQECLVSDLNDDYNIPIKELEKLGFTRKSGQSAEKYLSMYWNF